MWLINWKIIEIFIGILLFLSLFSTPGGSPDKENERKIDVNGEPTDNKWYDFKVAEMLCNNKINIIWLEHKIPSPFTFIPFCFIFQGYRRSEWVDQILLWWLY